MVLTAIERFFEVATESWKVDLSELECLCVCVCVCVYIYIHIHIS